MNKVFNKIILMIGFLLSMSTMALAQRPEAPSNETNFMDSFYASGKITVVVIGLASVLAILIFYLFRLERKLNNIEKEK